jgi:hypothetical protein
MPTALTVPTVKPEFSRKLNDPVFAASVVMLLLVFVSVYAPVEPSSSRPVALIRLLCVTLPVELKVRLPVVVSPTLDVTVPTVPIANPEFSRNETEPVEPASVVIAFALSVRT